MQNFASFITAWKQNEKAEHTATTCGIQLEHVAIISLCVSKAFEVTPSIIESEAYQVVDRRSSDGFRGTMPFIPIVNLLYGFILAFCLLLKLAWCCIVVCNRQQHCSTLNVSH